MSEITAASDGVEVTLTDLALTIVQDDVTVLPLSEVIRVAHARPRLGGLVNGHVVVHTVDGREFELHYRHDDAEFLRLADALETAVN